ncbi:hypothetical protein [Candidatus Chloroploca asiatica]|uniref:Uncharacterized protein n=1 Tax=Candidatus Chloroploca asiatica TaxID=1506545 RepID=A0A2H3KH19_9CHLR|nr:hypothetical protein [Candidatus Chloroploca asiatica]PDV97044.1 hypothetical protein A9Q02_19575 [Candidatus Chloroploca asiatica]
MSLRTHPNLFALLRDLLLRPLSLVRAMSEGRVRLRWVWLVGGYVVGATVGLLALLGVWMPVGWRAFVIGISLTLVLVWIGAASFLFGPGANLSLRALMTFSFVRSTVALAPMMLVGFTLLFSPALLFLQQDWRVIIGFVLLLGVWGGGIATVMLVLAERRDEPPLLRWVAIAGAWLIAGLLWVFRPVDPLNSILWMWALVGFGLGLLRPLSYLWQAALSVALVLLAWFWVPARRLLPWHPVFVDELALMPLPGLGWLLRRACRDEMDCAGPWLLRVAQHPAQKQVAQRALDGLIREGNGHIVLFWLSTDPQGIAWLQELSEATRSCHRLVALYAHLAAVTDLAAWPAVIYAHQDVLTAMAPSHGGVAVQALLEAGTSTLAADRWSTAMAALGRATAPEGVETDPLWEALTTLRVWTDHQVPVLLTDRAQALVALWETLDQLDGWPVTLLEAMAEHLLYLLSIEYQRGD